MIVRRALPALLAVFALAGLAACGSSSKPSSAAGTSSSAKTPVDLGTPLTNKGTKDISSAAAQTVSIELDDNYFAPTFIKAKPGATVTVDLRNEGKSEHSFTVDGTSVNKTMPPDSKASVTVTVPQNGALEFHCRFHGSLGMDGAFFTQTGATVMNASNGAGAATTTIPSGGGGYGGYGG